MTAWLLCAGYETTLRAARDAGGADLVATSPPYDDARDYDGVAPWSMDDYRRLGGEIFGALRPGGHALVVLDGPVREWREGLSTERSFTPWRVMLDWADRVGFRVPDRLAYARHGCPGGYVGRFRNDWEPLLWFQRPGGDGYFDKRSLAEDAKYMVNPVTIKSRRRDGSLYNRVSSGYCVKNRLRHRGTLWEYGPVGARHDEPAAESTDHPARFATRLAEDLVRCFAPPGGLVVDPFVGSGTVAVAAVRHGRRFLGGDVSARWAAVAATRARAEADGVGQVDRFAAQSIQLGLFEGRA